MSQVGIKLWDKVPQRHHLLKTRNSFLPKVQPHLVAYAAADADFHATLLNAKLAELEKEVRERVLTISISDLLNALP